MMASMCPKCRLATRSFQSLQRTRRHRSAAVVHSLRPSGYQRPFQTATAKPAAAEALAQQNEIIDEYTEQPPRSDQEQSLSPEQRRYLDAALRVNQAGELAAVLIYDAQTRPILRSHPHLRPLMKHMYDQEAGHFDTFNGLLAKHRIRPTAMYPVWRLAATALGWGTAVMGREAAMACTEAVETEIGQHYNDQVRTLLSWAEQADAKGEHLGEELTVLLKDLRRIRDEELEHLDEAVGEGAKEAKPYDLLTNVIRSGCRGAIWISERV